MKKSLSIILFLVLLAIPSTAQVKVGYFSYGTLLKAMPEYQTVQNDQLQLRVQYDAEMQRAETEFNSKYEEFLEGYQTYATSIRQKRQSELKELMERNIQFREESERLLQQAEVTALKSVKDKLNGIIKEVAQKNGYSLMLNTDNDACPYIDPSFADDVTTLLKESLNTNP